MFDGTMILYTIHLLVYIISGVLFVVNNTSSWMPSVCKNPDDLVEAGTVDFMMNKILFYTYLVEAGLGLIVVALSYYFKRGYLPPDLGKLKRLQAILGAC